MTASAVGALYDALEAFEGPRRGQAGAYPIHKRLTLHGAKQQDVYEWLGNRLELRGTDRVLDVGCGVGYGTIHLAERGVARATGLTISGRELESARRAASRSTHASAIEFIEESFDSPPRRQFDVIVAVESLKHSPDLASTLRGLKEILAPGGRLAIVEDVFEGDPSHASARRIADDWLLTRLYHEVDYVEALSPSTCLVVDLTDGVRSRGRLTVAGILAVFDMALPWLGPSRGAAWRAFRGGLHLERLYAAGMMRYVALFASKAGGESR